MSGFKKISKLILMSVVLTACDPDIEEICQDGLPQFSAEVQQIQTAMLNQDPKNVTNRTIASIETPKRTLKIQIPSNPEVQKKWMDWSSGYLSDIQVYMDVVQGSPEHIEDSVRLGEVAEELVLFYGFAKVWNSSEMYQSIQKISRKSTEIQRSICSNRAPTENEK